MIRYQYLTNFWVCGDGGKPSPWAEPNVSAHPHLLGFAPQRPNKEEGRSVA
jgi:hypothetical protein